VHVQEGLINLQDNDSQFRPATTASSRACSGSWHWVRATATRTTASAARATSTADPTNPRAGARPSAWRLSSCAAPVRQRRDGISVNRWGGPGREVARAGSCVEWSTGRCERRAGC
jgi:hypothetical protein